jgi:ubiquinol-cytochrome c reductase cytochrome c subunit
LTGLLLLTMLFTTLALTISRHPQEHSSSAVASEWTAYLSARQQDVNQGRRVYLRDCAFCHGNQGGGTSNGPDLTTSGTAYVDFMLRTGRMPLQGYHQPLQGPQSYPSNQLPRHPPAYSPAAIQAIVAYTSTFIVGGPSVPDVEPGDLALGRDLFLTDCAPCHSASATGVILPAGAYAPDLFPSSPKEVAEAIRLGPGPMPPFSDSQIDQAELNGVVSYVQDLGNKQDVGGHPLDFYGPISEGIVAWLIPLPLLVLFIFWVGKRAP